MPSRTSISILQSPSHKPAPMKRIVLLRHGQSTWNKENRFTGWTDVDLTQEGVAEAVRAGELLRDEGFTFGKAYTSYLKRAVKTLDCVLDKLDEAWIPVEKVWRLNEKHYGMLQGLNKSETAEKYGEEQVHVWRAELRRGPRPAARGRPAQPAFRRALRLRSRRRTAAHRIARTDDRTHPALLALRRLPVADAVRQPAGRRTTAIRCEASSSISKESPTTGSPRSTCRRPYPMSSSSTTRCVSYATTI